MNRASAEKYNLYKKMESLLEKDGFKVFSSDAASAEQDGDRVHIRPDQKLRYVVTDLVEKKPGKEPTTLQVPPRSSWVSMIFPPSLNFSTGT